MRVKPPKPMSPRSSITAAYRMAGAAIGEHVIKRQPYSNRAQRYIRLHMPLSAFTVGLSLNDITAGGQAGADGSLTICPGPRRRLSALSVFVCKSVLCGVFVWARRALNGQNGAFRPGQ